MALRYVKLSPSFSAFLHHTFAAVKRPLLEFRAAHYHRQTFRLRIPIVGRPNGSENPLWVRFRRESRIREIEVDEQFLKSRSGFSVLWRRLGVMVDLLSRPEIPAGEWSADLGDWVSEEGPLLGFCTSFRDTLLVPDRSFHATRGYERERRHAAAAPKFEDRDDTILWRGSASGIGVKCTEDMHPSDHRLRQRVRMCLLLRNAGIPGVDARFAAGALPVSEEVPCAAAGIVGPRVPQSSWTRRKFAIDVDGNSNAFSNFFVRLLYGCCVIKVASPRGYRQWYYDSLRPWQHFIPVAADLSDLVEKIDWCRHNQDQCRDVAVAGQALAMSMTMEREYHKVVENLRRHGAWDGRITRAA